MNKSRKDLGKGCDETPHRIHRGQK